MIHRIARWRFSHQISNQRFNYLETSLTYFNSTYAFVVFFCSASNLAFFSHKDFFFKTSCKLIKKQQQWSFFFFFLVVVVVVCCVFVVFSSLLLLCAFFVLFLIVSSFFSLLFRHFQFFFLPLWFLVSVHFLLQVFFFLFLIIRPFQSFIIFFLFLFPPFIFPYLLYFYFLLFPFSFSSSSLSFSSSFLFRIFHHDHINTIKLLANFSHNPPLGVFRWNLSDWKFLQVTKTQQNILANLSNVEFGLFRFFLWFPIPISGNLRSAPSAPSRICITVILKFHSSFTSRARFMYLFIFFTFLNFPAVSSGTDFIIIPTLFAFFQFYFVVSRDSKVHKSASSLFLLVLADYYKYWTLA